MSTPEQIGLKLTAARARLLEVIAGVSEEQFKRRPAPTEPGEASGWCIAEVLAHLLFVQQLLSGRIDLALQEDGVAVASISIEDSDAAAKSGRMAPVPQLIHGLLAAQRKVELQLSIVAAQPELLQRGVTHATQGRRTVEWLLEDMASHESEHVAQIELLKSG